MINTPSHRYFILNNSSQFAGLHIKCSEQYIWYFIRWLIRHRPGTPTYRRLTRVFQMQALLQYNGFGGRKSLRLCGNYFQWRGIRFSTEPTEGGSWVKAIPMTVLADNTLFRWLHKRSHCGVLGDQEPSCLHHCLVINMWLWKPCILLLSITETTKSFTWAHDPDKKGFWKIINPTSTSVL